MQKIGGRRDVLMKKIRTAQHLEYIMDRLSGISCKFCMWLAQRLQSAPTPTPTTYDLMKLPVRIRQVRSSLRDIMQLVHTPAPTSVQIKTRRIGHCYRWLTITYMLLSFAFFFLHSIICRLATR